MPHETTFDEQRVLQELEELRLAIRATREQRERVQAEFDAQLRAFEAPKIVRAPAIARPPSPAPVAPVKTFPSPVAATGTLGTLRSETAIDPSPVPDAPQPAAAESSIAEETTPRRAALPLLALVGGIVLVVSFAVVWMINRAPDASTRPPVQHEPRPVARLPPEPAAATPPAPPVDPHPVRIDLKTLRRVWLRVSVDGRIAIEREVAGGEQLPFGADRSIVVRAGDAGAVTVSVGGVDQGPIGKDGEVLTRTFPPPVR
jgi:hypothetical protein